MKYLINSSFKNDVRTIFYFLFRLGKEKKIKLICAKLKNIVAVHCTCFKRYCKSNDPKRIVFLKKKLFPL